MRNSFNSLIVVLTVIDSILCVLMNAEYTFARAFSLRYQYYQYFFLTTYLVTSFFETSKLWTSIISALVGMECQKHRIEPEKAIGTHRALPRLPSIRLGCHALYICIIFVYILCLD